MKKKLIIFIVVSLVFMVNIDVLAYSINVTCPTKELIVNNTTTCTVSGNASGGNPVSSLSSKLTATGNIEITSITTASIWQGDGEGGNIDLYSDSDKTNTFEIVKVVIKAKNNVGTGTLNLSGTKFYDNAFAEHNVSNNSLTINVKEAPKPVTPPKTNPVTPPKQETPQKSNDATLKMLSVNGNNIELKEKIYEYNYEVANEINKINIETETNNEKAKVILPDNLNIEKKENIFEIKVIAEDESEKIYKLKVNKLAEVVNNSSKLKSLTIDGYSLDFKADVFEYDLKDIKKSKLNIKAIAEEETATVEIIGNEDISKKDCVLIKVTSTDGTSSKYIIYANNTSNSNTLYIMIGILVFQLLINIITFAVSKKRREKM